MAQNKNFLSGPDVQYWLWFMAVALFNIVGYWSTLSSLNVPWLLNLAVSSSYVLDLLVFVSEYRTIISLLLGLLSTGLFWYNVHKKRSEYYCLLQRAFRCHGFIFSAIVLASAVIGLPILRLSERAWSMTWIIVIALSKLSQRKRGWLKIQIN